MKTKFLILLALSLSIGSYGQTVTDSKLSVSSGRVERIENFASAYIAPRNIDVWLPEDYSTTKKYNVIYMHDGQMLFDSTQTWNRKEWKVDEVVSQLTKSGKIEECIAVGIWNNSADRISEYFPNKIFEQLGEKTQKKLSEKYCNGKSANGDNYLKFLVTEVKPFIDKNFSTFSDKEHTFIMGSSMGGLISIYALSEYPAIFRGAACMSTAWLSQTEPNYEIPLVTFGYLKKNMPSANEHKIYMDYGTGESDKAYEITQSFVDLIANGKEYHEGNYMSKVYNKAEHNEVAWSQRLNVPLEFLLSKVQHQKASSGRIDLYENFPSNYISSRNVEVWLPEGYNHQKKYAVLYMHDGQMLFDAATTWNRQAWDVDDVAAKLLKEGKVKDFIVVGISNGGTTRHADYFPQKPYESLTVEQKNFINKQLFPAENTNETFKPISDNYLNFLISELKPFIDKKYSVYKDKSHTFIAGSSMGGLISMYAICEYPNIFGAAICMSTHWLGIFSADNNPVPEAFARYMSAHLPNPQNHKIYFDYGDKTLDALYPPLQKRIDEVMRVKGYTEKNWITNFFQGDDHSEKSWNSRLSIPIEFILKK